MKVGPFPQTTPDETETVDLTSDVAVGLPDLFAKKATSMQVFWAPMDLLVSGQYISSSTWTTK